MRLTQEEQRAICGSIHKVDPDARILLFGSRVNDEARGGDIDILCLSSAINRQQRRLIQREMGDRLAGQKIDLIVTADRSKPFVRLVMADAVPLSADEGLPKMAQQC
jgi:predicted nucleotidyltransferase